MLEKIKDFVSQVKEGALRDKCILAIEDSKVDSTLLLSILNKKYSRVLVAENATTGLEMALTNDPDLIVLDYNLPDIKGGEVLQKLKEDEKTRHIPVIVLTAEGTSDNICESFSNHAECFLLKPIDRKRLISEIDKQLSTMSKGDEK